jgi:putative ABC transport system permease protein
MSFSGKIISRNLFRNKARLLMGLIGIAGSVALLVCGFGMKDSLSFMTRKAFEKTMMHEAEIKLKQAIPPNDIESMVVGEESIDAAMAFSIYIYRDDATLNPYMVILDDDQKSLAFKDEKGLPISLPGSGALITPRMSRALGVGIGDEFAAECIDGGGCW